MVKLSECGVSTPVVCHLPKVEKPVRFWHAAQSIMKPFEIRGHHLEHIPEIMIDPTGWAERKAQAIWDNPEKRILVVSATPPATEICYRDDVIGKDTKALCIFTKKLTTVALQLYRLPDNHLIQVTHTRDEICQICMVGRHCEDEQAADHDHEIKLALASALHKSGCENIQFQRTRGFPSSIISITAPAKDIKAVICKTFQNRS